MAIITVSGNVGNSEFKISPSGTPVLTVSIADNRWNYKEEKEETFWIRAAWFGDRAEKLSNSVTKAKTITLTGREAYSLYDGKIDRSIEPIDHKILAFKKDDDTTSTRNNTSTDDSSYPPLSDDDIPFL